jgi:uncharacterized protein (TIGR02453 family)
MVTNTITDFLKKLKKNNNKEWFDKNRPAFENAKADYIALIDKIIKQMQTFDPTLVNNTSKEAIFRMNRDVRFSKDKTPYKTHFGASIKRGGKKSGFGGYYIHIEPGHSFVGGGLWMPEAASVKKVRQEIDYNFDAFKKIIGNAAFKKAYRDLERGKDIALTRPPKDYDAENPAIEYLKLKSFFVTKDLDDAEITDKNFLKQIISDFKTVHPLLSFINHSLED